MKSTQVEQGISVWRKTRDRHVIEQRSNQNKKHPINLRTAPYPGYLLVIPVYLSDDKTKYSHTRTFEATQ